MTASAILSQFEAAYGSGTSASLTLHCVSAGGAANLNEIHITLSPTLLPADQLAGMLATPDASDATDCPPSVRLPPAR